MVRQNLLEPLRKINRFSLIMACPEHWRIKRKIARHYDRIARIYNALYGYEQNLKIKEILKNVSVKPSDIVLDVGCGTGLLFEHIADVSGLVVGADISIGVLRRARELIKRRKLERVHLVRADADFLPFKNHVFDKVFAITLLQNMPDPQVTLKEMLRVAKGSSEIVLTGLKKAFAKEYFLRILMEAGLPFLILDTEERVKCHIAICRVEANPPPPAKNINNRIAKIVS
ncbi:MAG: methyltransferase domain-containing protein [Candidatus Bathyarchaeia archaeon]